MTHTLNRDVVARLVAESPVLRSVARQFRFHRRDVIYRHACRTLLDAIEPRWSKISPGILLWEWIATRNAAAVDAWIAIFRKKVRLQKGKMACNDLIAHDILRRDDVTMLRRFIHLGMLVPNETWIVKTVQVAADHCFLFLCTRFKSIISNSVVSEIQGVLFVRHRSDLLLAIGWDPGQYGQYISRHTSRDGEADTLSLDSIELSESFFRKLMDQAPVYFATEMMHARSPVLYHAAREEILKALRIIDCEYAVGKNNPGDYPFVTWAEAFAPEIAEWFDNV